MRWMRPRSFIDAREHSLTVSVPEQPLVLDADPMRIEQIITNLVLNAAKYTPPKGTVVVSASRQHDEAVIRVRETASAFQEICSPVFSICSLRVTGRLHIPVADWASA